MAVAPRQEMWSIQQIDELSLAMAQLAQGIHSEVVRGGYWSDAYMVTSTDPGDPVWSGFPPELST